MLVRWGFAALDICCHSQVDHGGAAGIVTSGRDLMKGAGRVKQGFSRLRGGLRPAAVILLYHRIADLPENPNSLAVATKHFAEHMKHIRRSCHPMRLLDLVVAMQRNSIPKRSVVVTFDDGYVDNLTQALPILTSLQIPATVFVVGGQIDSRDGFWWDRVAGVLLSRKALSQRLTVCIQGQQHEWTIASHEQRMLACKAVQELLRPLDAHERSRALADLVKWSGENGSKHCGSRPMTAGELLRLTQGGLVEIGAHTMTHRDLSALLPRVQYEEISNSRQKLEGIIGHPVRTFAYPYGTAKSFNQETVEIVRSAGFLVACTAIAGSVKSGQDPFRLPRCWVNDWGVGKFAENLELFFATH